MHDPEPQPARPSAAELTGELPRAVRDALADGPPATLDDASDTITALVDLGLPEPEAQAAVLERRVPLVLAAQVLGDEPPRYSLEDLAERSGVPADTLAAVRAATGLSVPERFSDADLEWARLLARLLEVLPTDAVVRSARARGAALAAIARADLALVRDELVLPMRQAGADDLTVSVALAETARALNPVARDLLVRTYQLQLAAELNSELSAIAARADGQEVEVAIGFADVVGYTALSSRVDPAGLDDLLEGFERRIVEVVSGGPDVAVVKYLGDAVMLVGSDPVVLADTLLELTTETEELADAPLRGGMAAGAVLVREGDFFGPVVNLAARLTDLARPWSLLADEDLADVLGARYDLRRLLPVRVRGLGLRRPVAVRRPAE